MIDNLTFNVAQLMKEAVGSSRHVHVAADLHELAPEIELAEDQRTVGRSKALSD